MKHTFYHGTTKRKAEKIMKEGFKTDGVKNNWKIKSKKGFVYFSLAYAPFYAMNNKEGTNDLALIKVEIDEKDLYPEDDFLMWCLGKPSYVQKDLDKVDFETAKPLWKASLKYMGNVSAKPDKVNILGVRYFNGKNLIMKCDPVICPKNFQILGDYYIRLTELIFAGKDIMEIKGFG